GWPTEREDYVPEGILQQSCELACAPSESSCDAGGACDSAVDAGRAYCTRQCLQCGVDCSIDCYNYSEGLIADPDGPPDPVGDYCRDGGDEFVGCTADCSTQCEAIDDEICRQAWNEPVTPRQVNPWDTEWTYLSPKEACRNDCPDRCAAACGYFDSPTPPHVPPPGSEDCYECCLSVDPLKCGLSSCQLGATCVSQCEDAYFGRDPGTTCSDETPGGCPAEVYEQCTAQCEPS